MSTSLGFDRIADSPFELFSRRAGGDSRNPASGAEASAGRATASCVEFCGVTKAFGSHKILDDLSFTATHGEHLALIGPSGSGKTTILRILMTLEPIDAGAVLVDGDYLTHELRNGALRPASERHLHRMRSKIGMVFQQFNLFPHKTALENITLAPVLSGMISKAEARQYGLGLLDLVGLAAKADEMPGVLSGGQKQRVAIARALALQPKIMLFDEITSALDPELVEEVLNVIGRLGRETDMTILLVTHEMSFAREFADRVLFFDAGKIVEEGPPEEIFKSPRCGRTQGFLRKIIAAGHSI